MNEKKEYYKILTEIWKMFREDMESVKSIESANDKAWTEMVARYEAIADNVPRETKAYATDMMLVHAKALEDMWRYK